MCVNVNPCMPLCVSFGNAHTQPHVDVEADSSEWEPGWYHWLNIVPLQQPNFIQLLSILYSFASEALLTGIQLHKLVSTYIKGECGT